MERFSCKTKITAGAGAVSALAEYGAKRLFLVTDPFFMKNGTAQRIAQGAKAERVEFFDQVIPDPTVELAAAGTARVQAFRPDLLVALGGGSAMDCAKAIGYFAGCDCPLVAIPTTSGSGSEVTDFAILTHNGVKHPLVDEKLRPAGAILDSDLLESLPKGLIADAGFDILAHALEARVGTDGGMVTECLATRAFCTAYRELPKSHGGDRSVRLDIHLAATMAGMAFTQAGLGLCHAMAHALGGLYHVPHGRLNAILLPVVIGCNSLGALGKYADLARAAGFPGGADAIVVRNLRNGLTRLRRQLELPGSLAEAGVEPERIHRDTQKILEATLADPCCGTNPVKPEAHMVRQILEEVTHRG